MILTTLQKQDGNGNSRVLVYCGAQRARIVEWDMSKGVDANHEAAAIQVASKMAGTPVMACERFVLPDACNHAFLYRVTF